MVSWNCRSLYRKLQEFKKYLIDYSPHVVCLQETWIVPSCLPTFHGYTCILKNRVANRGGGLATLVRNDLTILPGALSLPGSSNVEAQMVSFLGTGLKIDIINIYNPNNRVSLQQWNMIFRQSKNTTMVTGDFNCHHWRWDTRRPPCATGRALSDAVDENHIELVTPTDLVTYIGSASGYTESTLDLMWVSSNIRAAVRFRETKDMGSDHMVVEYTAEILPRLHVFRTRRRWKLTEGNWGGYRDEMRGKAGFQYENTASSLAAEVGADILLSASNHVGRTKGIINTRRSAAWWSTQCDSAIRARKDAHKRMRRRPCPTTIAIYRRARARARSVVDRRKQESRREFMASVRSTTSSKTAWRKIKTFSRKSTFETYPITRNDKPILSDKEKAEEFAKTFKNTPAAAYDPVPSGFGRWFLKWGRM